MGVSTLIWAIMGFAGLVFLMVEALKEQLQLTGRTVFVLGLLLGGFLGAALAWAGLAGMGVELLPNLPVWAAGLLIGLLSGIAASGFKQFQKSVQELGALGRIQAAQAAPVPVVAVQTQDCPAPDPEPTPAAEPGPEPELRPIRPDEVPMQDY
ncbi:hypothetical protein [Deinococcus sp. Marseille-Q6407]|uniref:hypothetical protein n=1 Tax=Deinococcus sp. Marseille-Q6407 TaxID=2969223 RepID=UPI0021BEFAD8|nr:hypothetical protein [Deinococcus sp. Marseille-Q6407]